MKKLITALFLTAMLISVPTAAAAAGGFGNFTLSGLYETGMFRDVSESDWYAGYVAAAFDYGFMYGKGGGVFDPAGELTLGEAVTLAVRLGGVYNGEAIEFASSGPFYKEYVDYALERGIIGEHGDYTENITRKEFAQLVYSALPEAVFAAINTIPDYGICDVMPDSEQGNAIYALYRAGIMTGSDRYGTFFPESPITRAEACAVLTRVAERSLRVSASLPEGLPPEVVYGRSADAVFMLETFDSEGNTIRNGSGFFISSDGLAVTNEHVIAGASYAIITLHDGRAYPVMGVCSVSAELDLAVVYIERDESDWSYLNLADSDLVKAGESVYALGSPFELLNAISYGVVANASREVDGFRYFQFTAAISFGSGGGPVLNSMGQVVGVACSSFNGGQRLNLAVPISLLREMEIGECEPLNPDLENY